MRNMISLQLQTGLTLDGVGSGVKKSNRGVGENWL
jgi:hypothetical protein